MKKNSANSSGEHLGNTKQDAPKKGWVFTVNNYTESDFDFFVNYFSSKVPAKYVIGREVGEKEKTPHLQICASFDKKMRFTALKKDLPPCHIEPIKGTWAQNIKYCSKEGNYVSNVRELKKTRKQIILEKYYSGITWKPWQQELINICESERESRKIHWIYDRIGNNGKTFVCKYIACKHNPIICNGKADNIFNQVNDWLTAAEPDVSPSVVICDIPRCNTDYVSYMAIEKLKDGIFYSGKYEGGVCIFEPPHIICLANELPDKSKMSRDRWNIKNLNSNFED